MWTLQNHLVANWAVIVLFLKHFKWFTLNKKSHYNKLKSLIFFFKKKKKKKSYKGSWNKKGMTWNQNIIPHIHIAV